MFGPWAPELLMFDLKIGFLVKNCICCQLEMSRIPTFGQAIMTCMRKYDILEHEVWVNHLFKPP